jgi:TetR/AcrR family transcriptional repressor of nem operon
MPATRQKDTARRERPRATDTATRILDSAERLVQAQGFNGFSYADVAGELGITKASLHYHFAGKAELGLALITRYGERFGAALAQIERDLTDAPAKLDAYAALYADVIRGHRMCLCGMLAAEYATLPQPIRERLIAFFDDNEAWLERVLNQGVAEGSLRLSSPPRQTARLIVSALEGAMLVARPYADLHRFQAAATDLLATLSSTAPPRDRGMRGSPRSPRRAPGLAGADAGDNLDCRPLPPW